MDNAKILIIDDDEIDRELIKKSLKLPYSIDISEANTGEKGLNLIFLYDFDCIILDHLLPDYDSIALLSKIRDNRVLLPIIIVTGYGDELLVAKIFKAGGSDYIPKNKINSEILSSIVDAAIKKYKSQLESFIKDLNVLRKINSIIIDKLGAV